MISWFMFELTRIVIPRGDDYLTLNPNLLMLGRPKRWHFLTVDMKLKPLHNEPWKNVLVNAHEKLICAAENWIKR